ncbi:MAG: PQQ-dependent sugar dehydrogenase [Ferruginibacter sp.]
MPAKGLYWKEENRRNGSIAAWAKFFKITKDGKAAPGNPFINTPNAMPEIYSYGHRNPQGLAINPATGDLWKMSLAPGAVMK